MLRAISSPAGLARQFQRPGQVVGAGIVPVVEVLNKVDEGKNRKSWREARIEIDGALEQGASLDRGFGAELV